MIALKIFDNYWKEAYLLEDINSFANNMMTLGFAINNKK
jgi:hypothetical protein